MAKHIVHAQFCLVFLKLYKLQPLTPPKLICLSFLIITDSVTQNLLGK